MNRVRFNYMIGSLSESLNKKDPLPYEASPSDTDHDAPALRHSGSFISWSLRKHKKARPGELETERAIQGSYPAKPKKPGENIDITKQRNEQKNGLKCSKRGA